jgi:hypothetical protein
MDEVDGTNGFDNGMQGGDLVKSSVVLQKPLEGQDGLVPLAYEITMKSHCGMTRMEFKLESHGVGLNEDKILNANGVASLA